MIWTTIKSQSTYQTFQNKNVFKIFQNFKKLCILLQTSKTITDLWTIIALWKHVKVQNIVQNAKGAQW